MVRRKLPCVYQDHSDLFFFNTSNLYEVSVPKKVFREMFHLFRVSNLYYLRLRHSNYDIYGFVRQNLHVV